MPISDKQKKFLISSIRKVFPKTEILVFGSRIRDDFKKNSDLDLCLKSDAPLELTQLGTLKEIFSQSDLPYKIDLVDWNRISPEFQENILNQCEHWK